MSEQQPKTETLKAAKKSEKNKEEKVKQLIKWVYQIKDEFTRGKSLEELSHKRNKGGCTPLYVWK
jgi:hypothetical protein